MQTPWSSNQAGGSSPAAVSIFAMNWAWGQKLAPTAKLILMALADAADDQGVCWPSVATVANKCGVSTRTVRRVMQALVADGILQSEQRYRNDGSSSSNLYRLRLRGGDTMSHSPDSCDSTPGHGCQGDPDTSVIPRTTNRTINKSPPLQEIANRVATSESVECGGRDLSDLEYPKGLSASERQEAASKLAGVASGLAQQLMDELAAGIQADSIRATPLAYLRGLIKRAQNGSFTPEAGLRIAEQRKHRTRIEAARRSSEEATCERLTADTPILDSRLARKIAAIRRRSQGID